MQTLILKMDCGSMYDTNEDIWPALQSRLSRRILPRLTHNGIVEYGIQIPSNYTPRIKLPRPGGSSISGNKPGPEGIDIDWIMKGTGSLSRGSSGSYVIPKVTINPGSGKLLQSTNTSPQIEKTMSLCEDEYIDDISSSASQDPWNRNKRLPGIG